MTETPKLHSSIRVYQEPRMSAVSMAEYLVLKAAGQDQVLHDSKYSQTVITAAYAAPRRAFRDYNTDPHRPISILNKVKASLLSKSQDPKLKGKQKDKYIRDSELIDLFLLREQSLGLRNLPLAKMPKLKRIDVEGVSLSIQPDFLIETPTGKIGSVILRVTKAPDPDACKRLTTKEERGEHRRELARYLIAMQEMILNAQPQWSGKVDRNLIFVSDIRLGEKISTGKDHISRLREVSAAARQIERQWDGIRPNPRLFAKD